ncbi:hypothetical protein ACFL6B_03185 [Thermodesulfobacteriota bacterium]
MNKARLGAELLLLALLFSPQRMLADCSGAHSYADDAYLYARKGYESDNLDDIRFYAKKAMSTAENAMTAADDCGGDDAYIFSEDGYSYALKAYQSDDLNS